MNKFHLYRPGHRFLAKLEWLFLPVVVAFCSCIRFWMMTGLISFVWRFKWSHWWYDLIANCCHDYEFTCFQKVQFTCSLTLPFLFSVYMLIFLKKTNSWIGIEFWLLEMLVVFILFCCLPCLLFSLMATIIGHLVWYFLCVVVWA